MADDSEVTEEKKKGGFFRKLFKLAFIAAIVAGVAAIFKRRRGSDVDDVDRRAVLAAQANQHRDRSSGKRRSVREDLHGVSLSAFCDDRRCSLLLERPSQSGQRS